jgi:hypothetical protein
MGGEGGVRRREWIDRVCVVVWIALAGIFAAVM